MQPGAGETAAEPIWGSLRRGPGSCSSAPEKCGWLLHRLNEHAADEYVVRVSFAAAAGLSATERRAITDALDGAVVLRGRLEGSTLLADQAYRALPLEAPPVGGSFVRVTARPPDHCLEAVCPPSVAQVLNFDLDVSLRSVDLSPATSAGVDTDWLENRVFERGAVLSGTFTGRPGLGIDSFVAHQIFIPVPDRSAPCAPAAQACSRGTVPTYERDVDRCLVPLGCSTPRSCGGQPPQCRPGYVLRAWRTVRGCPAFACDPAFLPE